MAITESSLTGGASTTNGTSFVTASITPTAGRLQLLSVHANYASVSQATAPTLTITGNSLTWELITTIGFSTDGAGAWWSHVFLYRAMGTPSTGTITIDSGALVFDACGWTVTEYAGVSTTGTNGSGAIVQSSTNSGAAAASLTVTLSAFASTNNATYGTFASDVLASTTFTPDSGFTELYDTGAGYSWVETEWRNNNSTSVGTTPSASVNIGGIAVEIRAQVSGGLIMLSSDGGFLGKRNTIFVKVCR